MPQSDLKFFPNHLAYRQTAFAPPPARFVGDRPETLEGLAGETVDVVTIVRMPGEVWPADREVREGEEVVREWVGVELGIVSVEVRGDRVENR